MKLRTISEDKKGLSINDIYPVILILATIAILLAIMLMVMTAWQETTNTNTASVTNETLTAVDYLGDTVSNASRCGFDTFAVGVATNATDGVVINAANYTVDSDAGTVTISTAGAAGIYNGTDWNVTYTFNYGGEDCEAMDDIITDFVDFVPWIGIILLVIAAAIVLGIVISSFRKPKI